MIPDDPGNGHDRADDRERDREEPRKLDLLGCSCSAWGWWRPLAGWPGEFALDALAGASRPAAGVWAAWFTSWSLTLVFPAGLLLFVLLLVAVLVAAVFNPLRRRVQATVDRRFDRARYDAERVVAQFAVQLREQVDLDVLGAGLLGVVNHVLAPEHVTLWLNEGGSRDGGGGLTGEGAAADRPGTVLGSPSARSGC